MPIESLELFNNLVEKYEKLKSKNKKKYEHDFTTTTTYDLWAESGGYCLSCKRQLLEFAEEEFETKDKNIGQRAHIISLKSTDYRPPFVELYNKELKDALVLKEENDFFSPESLNNRKNLILLCKECHGNFDKKIFKVDRHEASAMEMLNLKKGLQLNNINSMDLVISTIFTAKSAEVLILGFIKSKGEHTFSINFDAMTELYKYRNLHSDNTDMNEERIILEKILNLTQNGDATNSKISSVIKEIKNYFESKKDNPRDGIQKFWFNVKFDEISKLLSLTLTTVRDFSNNIDSAISFEQLRNLTASAKKDILKRAPKNKHEWITNGAEPYEKIVTKRDYILLENLLISSLDNFANSGQNHMSSFSVAYMARWGTGKTTLIRTLMNQRKQLFRFVEINLWHISNSITDIDKQEDNPFIRNIVKEALTQMSNDEDVVKNYLEATKIELSNDSKINLAKNVLNKALSLPENNENNNIQIITERNKFIDQYIYSLSNFINTLFSRSKKPIVFVFDDLDRVTENKNIIKILDALVAFLNLKNCIFIIPIDESKVIKALYETKKGINPNSFINKYFNYTVRAPFIPNLERFRAFDEIVESSLKDSKISNTAKELIVQIINPTYRDIKDFINQFNNNKYLFENDENNPFYKGQTSEQRKNNEKLFVLGTLMQMNFPLFTDYLAIDMAHNISLKVAIEDIEKILIYIRDGGKNHEDELNLKDSEFWSALMGEKFLPDQSKTIGALFSRSDAKNNDYKNDLDFKTKEKLYEITKKLIEYERVIGISKLTSIELVTLWVIITQAELTKEIAKTFARISPIHSLLLYKSEEEFKAKISLLNSSSAMEEYFKEMDNFVKDNYVRSFERDEILKNTFDNFSEILQTIDKNELEAEEQHE